MLAVLGAASGCGEMPQSITLPRKPAHDAATARGQRVRGLPRLRFMCSTALRTYDPQFPWRYGRVELRFPVAEIPSDGRTIRYRYLGYKDATTLIAIAECNVPATSRAVERVNRILAVNNGRDS